MESRRSLVSPLPPKKPKVVHSCQVVVQQDSCEDGTTTWRIGEEKSELCILIRVSIYGLLRKARQRLTLDATTLHDRTS
jgi:hypothetical protein